MFRFFGAFLEAIDLDSLIRPDFEIDLTALKLACPDAFLEAVDSIPPDSLDRDQRKSKSHASRPGLLQLSGHLSLFNVSKKLQV
ncbi:MAG TPA: hypothetical protein VGY77_06340 [Gemmataceae bacterium]|jgi:hypothetical protein|nr:hypothetical protein [Gemmataceae bacterium]